MRTLAFALKVFCKKQALKVRVVNNSAKHYKPSFREESLAETQCLALWVSENVYTRRLDE
jgi:hypothetical protein